MRRKKEIDLQHFLAVAAVEIQKNGYTSRTKATELGIVSTADMVLELVEDDAVPAEKLDTAAAEAVIDWATKPHGDADPIDPKPLNEYRQKLLVIALGRVVTRKSAGYAASMIGAYEREERFKAESDARAQAKRNTSHVGTEGERLRGLEVRVLRVKTFDGRFGPRDIVTFETLDTGSEVVWFTAADHGLTRGDTYKIDATVKEHKAYRGVPQTVVTRAAVVENRNMREAS